MEKQGFEELEVWQKARLLKIEVRALTDGFPPEEKSRLTDKLIRSSRSVCTLIAEGDKQHPFPNRIKYCIAARDSLNETLGHLVDAYDEKYISEKQISGVRVKIAEVEKLLNIYISWFEGKPKTDGGDSQTGFNASTG